MEAHKKLTIGLFGFGMWVKDCTKCFSKHLP